MSEIYFAREHARAAHRAWRLSALFDRPDGLILLTTVGLLLAVSL